MAAIRGAAAITERGRSRSGARHSPANTLALSNPDRAPIAAFVKTFRVRMENVGSPKENGGYANATPLFQRFARRYSIKPPRAIVRTDPVPVNHFPKCSPRTFTAKTHNKKIKAALTIRGVLFIIHFPRGPAM